ncbi:MAG: UDP-N-acetylmuramate dehydrogenase [Clostridia bacterium]|nr:UDP-N-acetylmuramate dehydrogenase [Clostridia bacterium]
MNTAKRLLTLAESLGCSAKENEPMSLHTTFKIGGKAKLFIKVNSKENFRTLLLKAKDFGMPINVIGNGSNMLVTDDDIDAVFFQLSGGEFDEIKLIDDTTIVCGAGVSLAKLCLFACENSLTGLEFAYGIPALLGGAVFMNSGAYNGEIGNVIVSCTHITPNGEFQTLPKSALDFSYRNSAYKSNGCYVTDVMIKLCKGNKSEINDKMKDYMARRRDKQPLEFPSAGSVFKRPENHFAGALIEQCGLKGKTIGGAQISRKHAGFIINIGNATCADVLDLIEFTRNTVLAETGVELEPEVLLIK